jgi:hypothetical protein
VATIGCVNAEWRPTFTVSLSGPYAEFARHVAAAQGTGIAGAPGGRPLTRLIDPVLNAANGNTACPSTYVRPVGKSCDEYPFRSTYQGAYTGGGLGRTFSWCQIPDLPLLTSGAGWSACMITAGQNSGAGTALGRFYTDNRIIGEDNFYVAVVP